MVRLITGFAGVFLISLVLTQTCMFVVSSLSTSAEKPNLRYVQQFSSRNAGEAVLLEVYATTVNGSLPIPQVTLDSFPSSATVRTPITIAIHGANNGAIADKGDLQISFPLVTDKNQVESSSDIRIITAGAGDPIYQGYGSPETNPAQYVLVEATKAPWGNGETHSLRVTVTPQTPGQFEFLFKLTMAYGGHAAWTSDPTRGAGVRDQQNEFDYERTIQITAGPPLNASISYVPLATTLLGSVLGIAVMLRRRRERHSSIRLSNMPHM
jgi:hypothetical protein